MYIFHRYNRSKMVIKQFVYSLLIARYAMKIIYIFALCNVELAKPQTYYIIIITLLVYLWRRKEFTPSVTEKPKEKQT
ncbi:hypothetical protein M2137_001221 [Parabacteroides sp. PFB2-10]|nr:hypothetical protein [Parabacteroides sp. PFB2-10]